MSRGRHEAQGRTGRSREQTCAVVAGQLRLRHEEIEQTILAYVRDTVPDRIGDLDVEYALGLRAAVVAAVEYGLTGIEQGDEWLAPIPLEALIQARRAVRGGVGLDTVLRRYIAGYALLEDFVMDAVEALDVGNASALRRLRRVQATLLDRLMSAIADEYCAEQERGRRSSAQRLGERVQRLLVGEAIDLSDLGYELDVWHLGVIAIGNSAERALRGMAAQIGRAILLVPRGEETVWAWLGDRRRLAVADLQTVLLAKLPPGVTLAIGEPARGLSGFRLTHRQAEAAHLVAQRRPQSLTRYADVALLAFALRDEALARSLVDIYPVLRETVRAYLAAERNATSAAAALGVARHTVESRIRRAEGQLGRLLPACVAEIEVALRLDELGCFVTPRDQPRIDRSSIA
jgi:hypothetical protein